MAEKKGKKGGRRIPIFYVIYLIVMLAVILTVMILLGIVRNRLAEYEAVQPRYVAEEVYTKYFEPIDYTSLLTDAQYNAGEAEFDDIVSYLMDEIGEEELTYSIGLSNEQSELKYIVKAGSKQLAAIVLKESDKKTEHGFQTYEFSYLELYLNTEAYLEELSRLVVMFEIPKTYSVTVDGELLSTEFLTETYVPSDVMKYYPPDVPEIEYAVYTITTLKELPEEVVVTDFEGKEVEVDFDEDTFIYRCGLSYSESMASDYSEFVTKALEGYAAYVQASKNVSLGNIKGYFDTDSDAYADVVAAGGNRWMVREWSGIDFENVNIGEFYIHTPEVFSCRISFTQLLHRVGREDYVDVIDMYVFLHLTDEGYKIYDWFNAT